MILPSRPHFAGLPTLEMATLSEILTDWFDRARELGDFKALEFGTQFACVGFMSS